MDIDTFCVELLNKSPEIADILHTLRESHTDLDQNAKYAFHRDYTPSFRCKSKRLRMIHHRLIMDWYIASLVETKKIDVHKLDVIRNANYQLHPPIKQQAAKLVNAFLDAVLADESTTKHIDMLLLSPPTAHQLFTIIAEERKLGTTKDTYAHDAVRKIAIQSERDRHVLRIRKAINKYILSKSDTIMVCVDPDAERNVENATRLCIYKAMLDMGVEKERSQIERMQLFVDVHSSHTRSDSVMQRLERIYLDYTRKAMKSTDATVDMFFKTPVMKKATVLEIIKRAYSVLSTSTIPKQKEVQRVYAIDWNDVDVSDDAVLSGFKWAASMLSTSASIVGTTDYITRKVDKNAEDRKFLFDKPAVNEIRRYDESVRDALAKMHSEQLIRGALGELASNMSRSIALTELIRVDDGNIVFTRYFTQKVKVTAVEELADILKSEVMPYLSRSKVFLAPYDKTILRYEALAAVLRVIVRPKEPVIPPIQETPAPPRKSLPSKDEVVAALQAFAKEAKIDEAEVNKVRAYLNNPTVVSFNDTVFFFLPKMLRMTRGYKFYRNTMVTLLRNIPAGAEITKEIELEVEAIYKYAALHNIREGFYLLKLCQTNKL